MGLWRRYLPLSGYPSISLNKYYQTLHFFIRPSKKNTTIIQIKPITSLILCFYRFFLTYLQCPCLHSLFIYFLLLLYNDLPHRIYDVFSCFIVSLQLFHYGRVAA